MKREGKKRKGNGVHKDKATRRCISAIYGADTPGPILAKFGVHIALRDLIKTFNFCDKIFGDFRPTGVKIPVFRLTMLVIVTTVL